MYHLIVHRFVSMPINCYYFTTHFCFLQLKNRIGLEDGDAAGTVGVGDRLGDELTVLGKTDLYRRIVKLITCGSGGLLEDVCPKRKRGKEHLAVLVGVALVDFCPCRIRENEMYAGERNAVLIGLDDTDMCIGGVVCESNLLNSARVPDPGRHEGVEGNISGELRGLGIEIVADGEIFKENDSVFIRCAGAKLVLVFIVERENDLAEDLSLVVLLGDPDRACPFAEKRICSALPVGT